LVLKLFRGVTSIVKIVRPIGLQWNGIERCEGYISICEKSSWPLREVTFFVETAITTKTSVMTAVLWVKN
jgi:hypothetical protein